MKPEPKKTTAVRQTAASRHDAAVTGSSDTGKTAEKASFDLSAMRSAVAVLDQRNQRREQRRLRIQRRFLKKLINGKLKSALEHLMEAQGESGLVNDGSEPVTMPTIPEQTARELVRMIIPIDTDQTAGEPVRPVGEISVEMSRSEDESIKVEVLISQIRENI